MIVGSRELLGNIMEKRPRRHDIQYRELGHTIVMVERHAMSDASAAIMTDHRELFEAEMLHHFDLILGHGALRVAGVILTIRRLAAIAIAAQIRGDHREVFRERGRDLMPDHVRLRIAVQQQQSGSAAARNGVDLRAAGFDFRSFKAFKHRMPPLSKSLYFAAGFAAAALSKTLRGFSTSIVCRCWSVTPVAFSAGITSLWMCR